jgi:hypothetical protein
MSFSQSQVGNVYLRVARAYPSGYQFGLTQTLEYHAVLLQMYSNVKSAGDDYYDFAPSLVSTSDTVVVSPTTDLADIEIVKMKEYIRIRFKILKQRNYDIRVSLKSNPSIFDKIIIRSLDIFRFWVPPYTPQNKETFKTSVNGKTAIVKQNTPDPLREDGIEFKENYGTINEQNISIE